MRNELVTINNVRGYLDDDNTAWLNLEDVARGLGFTQVKNNKEYIRWETVISYCNEFSQLVGKESFIPENVFDMMMRNPEKIGEMLIEYGRTRKENEQLKLDNKIKEQQITELQPKAEYTDVILQCKDLVTITVIAKDYGKLAVFMNELLHKLGVQYKESGVWFLYQKYAECGYTRTKTFAVGDNNAKTHTYWTQKGRLFIYNLLKENGYLPIMEDRDYE